MNAPQGKIKAYALIRDADGKPVIDNIHGIPIGLWQLLTFEERIEIQKQGGYPSYVK